MASVWHPDRFRPGTKQYERATEKLKEINEAYEVLKDPKKRAAYDDLLKRAEGVHRQRSSSGLTPEQEKLVEHNRHRYVQALRSASLLKFCEAAGLGEARQKALADLQNYQPGLAKELLSRFVTTARG